jgi:hypothetical protein
MAVVLSSTLAAATTRWWDTREDRAAQESALSLTVLVAGTPMLGGGADGSSMSADVSVAVANTGPLPVTVENIHASQDGLNFQNNTAQVVRPGVLSIRVSLKMDCQRGVPKDPVRVVVSARTADGAVREASSLMAVVGTSWDEAFQVLCNPDSHHRTAVVVVDGG